MKSHILFKSNGPAVLHGFPDITHIGHSLDIQPAFGQRFLISVSWMALREMYRVARRPAVLMFV